MKASRLGFFISGHILELMVILLIALIIFGPQRLPEATSSLAKALHEFRKATGEFEEAIMHHVNAEDEADEEENSPTCRRRLTWERHRKSLPLSTRWRSAVRRGSRPSKCRPRLQREPKPTTNSRLHDRLRFAGPGSGGYCVRAHA